MISAKNIIFGVCILLATLLSKDFIMSLIPNRDLSAQDSIKLELPFKVYQIEESKIDRYIKVSGIVNNRYTMTVKPPSPGVIKFVNQNPACKKGDILLQLDDAVENGSIQKAQGNLQRAQDKLNRAEKRAKQSGSVAESEMSEYKAELAIWTGELAIAEAKKAEKRVVAPFDGVPGIPQHVPGEWIRDQVILNYSSSDKDLIVDFIVPQSEQQNVRVGKKILLLPDDKSEISFVNATIENVDCNIADSYAVKIRCKLEQSLDIGQNKLVVGSPVTVLVAADNSKVVLNVAEAAIEEKSGVNSMYLGIPKGNGVYTVQKTPVTVSYRSNGRAVLTPSSTIQKGATYLVGAVGGCDGKDIINSSEMNPANAQVSQPIQTTLADQATVAQEMQGMPSSPESAEMPVKSENE